MWDHPPCHVGQPDMKWRLFRRNVWMPVLERSFVLSLALPHSPQLFPGDQSRSPWHGPFCMRIGWSRLSAPTCPVGGTNGSDTVLLASVRPLPATQRKHQSPVRLELFGSSEVTTPGSSAASGSGPRSARNAKLGNVADVTG